jgi:CheY-like chemotaxis protein
MITQLLERAGYEVMAVPDGAQAVATARRAGGIDVLVTDVVMPGMSGIELAEQMMDGYPLMGVVLLSGYTAETLDIERVTAHGATFVSKPVSSHQLARAVLEAVASRRLAAERR